MFNLLRNSCKQGLSKRTIRLACTVSPRLEMIKAVGAAWNHYWCTLMKSHLFEVQALCLSSNTCVHVCVCVFMCVHEQACIHLSVPVHEHSVFVCTKSSFSLSLSFVKLTPLKTRCREEIGSWGNLISLKCQARSSKPLPAIKYMSSIPSLRIKRFLWQRTRFCHCCVAPVLRQDNPTAFSCRWHCFSHRTSACRRDRLLVQRRIR